jgi:hypothetical protein
LDKTYREFRDTGLRGRLTCRRPTEPDLGKITQEVRDYAAKKGIDGARALDAGMREKAEEFKQQGAQIYVDR